MKKIGFLQVLALVIGAQIGAGIFMTPSIMAQYGFMSLYGWLFSGVGAIAIALIFSKLCNQFPYNGGPHTYVNAMFGKSAAFFTGWTYWVVSLVSNIVLIKAVVSYLIPLIGQQSEVTILALEVCVLLVLTLVNIMGINAVGSIELLLTILKIIPMIIVPIIALFFFKMDNFGQSDMVLNRTFSDNLNHIMLLTMFGFIGIELATTPAGSVKNPKKTIPISIISGTLIVLLIYILNSVSIMGAMPFQELSNSKAPYADVIKNLLAGDWNIVVSAAASIVCLSTLNAWILSGGQVALGLSEDGLLPKFFGKKNKEGAPYAAIITGSICTLPILLVTYQPNVATQVEQIIDFSVAAFLFVYVACIISFFTFLLKESKLTLWSLIYGATAFLFCMWSLLSAGIETIIVSSLFTLSGIPMYLYICKKTKAAK